jgi:hypothetical protein
MSTHIVDEPTPIVGAGQHERRSIEVAGAGATTEAIGAAGAIVLAIIGLAGMVPGAMMAVATIVLGAAIFLDAITVGARYNRLVREAYESDGTVSRMEVGGGISAGTIGGIAGVVLGVLALLGFMPPLLCSIALIVFGGALLFASGAKARLASLGTLGYGVSGQTRHIVDEAIAASSGGELLIGIGAVVLGILALLMQSLTQTFVFVGFLGVGAIILLSGSAISARMMSILRRDHVRA